MREKSLIKLKEQKEKLLSEIKSNKQIFDAFKAKVETSEKQLKCDKSKRNYAYKVWKSNRDKLKTLDNKIKTLPSQLRKYVKEHPIEALENINSKS